MDDGQHQIYAKKWNRIWGRKSIPKVKTFIWKATHRAVSVNAELTRQGVLVSPIWPSCGNPKTVSHALLNCAWSRNTWFGGMNMRWNTSEEMQWDEWLKYVQEMENRDGEQGQKR